MCPSNDAANRSWTWLTDETGAEEVNDDNPGLSSWKMEVYWEPLVSSGVSSLVTWAS